MGKSRKGMTLIELIITMAIMSVVTSLILFFYDVISNQNSSDLNNISLVDQIRNTELFMRKDIRLSNNFTEPVASGSNYIFPGTGMDIINDYCIGKGYKPLLYMEQVNKDKCYYAYDNHDGTLHRMIVPVDTTTTSVVQYRPDDNDLKSTNKGTLWDDIPDTDLAAYTTITPGLSAITNEIYIRDLKINFNGTDYTTFTVIGAYHNTTTLLDYCILKAVTAGSVYFQVKMHPETFVYYLNTVDKKIAEYIPVSGGVDGIKITKGFIDGSTETYYDVEINASRKGVERTGNFRIALYDYGGYIK